MKTLTLTAKQDKIPGFWRIKANGKTVGALVQPNYEVSLGITPTAENIRTAIAELQPKFTITVETAVVFE